MLRNLCFLLATLLCCQFASSLWVTQPPPDFVAKRSSLGSLELFVAGEPQPKQSYSRGRASDAEHWFLGTWTYSIATTDYPSSYSYTETVTFREDGTVVFRADGGSKNSAGTWVARGQDVILYLEEQPVTCRDFP